MKQLKKYILLILFIQALLPVLSQPRITSGTIVFNFSKTITDSGRLQMRSQMSKLYDQLKAEISKSEDTMMGQALLHIATSEMDKSILNPDTLSSTIKIKFSPDTIWQYKLLNDTLAGDYLRIDHLNGKSWYHAKINSKIVYAAPNRIGYFESDTIKINKSDRKKILGFDCYKVTYEMVSKEAEEEDLNLNEGNTIYEMYVTEKIKLPLHSLFITAKLMNAFFPLEIKKYNANFNGLIEEYKATSFNPAYKK